MTTEHTSTPWTVITKNHLEGADGHLIGRAMPICDAEVQIDEAYKLSDANAAFIVLAVNSHDALVKALVVAEKGLDRREHPDFALMQVRAALALANGE